MDGTWVLFLHRADVLQLTFVMSLLIIAKSGYVTTTTKHYKLEDNNINRQTNTILEMTNSLGKMTNVPIIHYNIHDHSTSNGLNMETVAHESSQTDLTNTSPKNKVTSYVIVQESHSNQQTVSKMLHQTERPPSTPSKRAWLSIYIHPTVLEQILEDKNLQITFNCSHGDGIAHENQYGKKESNVNKMQNSLKSLSSYRSTPVLSFQSYTSPILYFTISTAQKRVVIPRAYSLKNVTNKDNSSLTFPVDCTKGPHSFRIHTNTVGRTVLTLQISKTAESAPLYTSEIAVSCN